MEVKEIETVIFTYLHALLNLKHLGSIERIEDGISIICRWMTESKNPELAALTEKFLEKILSSLENNSKK